MPKEEAMPEVCESCRKPYVLYDRWVAGAMFRVCSLCIEAHEEARREGSGCVSERLARIAVRI